MADFGVNPKDVKIDVTMQNPLLGAIDTKRKLRLVGRTGIAAMTNSLDQSTMFIVPLVSIQEGAIFKDIYSWFVHWMLSPAYSRFFAEGDLNIRSQLATWCLLLFTDKIYETPYKIFMKQPIEDMVLNVTMTLEKLGMHKQTDVAKKNLEAALKNLTVTVEQAVASAFTEAQKSFTTKLLAMVAKVVANLETKVDAMNEDEDEVQDNTVRVLPGICMMIGKIALWTNRGKIQTMYASYLNEPKKDKVDPGAEVKELADLNGWDLRMAKQKYSEFNLMIGSATSEFPMTPTVQKMTLEQLYGLIKTNKIQYVSGPEYTQRMMNFSGKSKKDIGERACAQLRGGAFQLHVTETYDKENNTVWRVVDRNHSLAHALKTCRKHSAQADCPIKVGKTTMNPTDTMYVGLGNVSVTVVVWQDTVENVTKFFGDQKKARQQTHCANFNASLLMVLLLRCGAIGNYPAVPFYLCSSGDKLAFQDKVQAELGGDWTTLPRAIMAWANKVQGVKGPKACGPFDVNVEKKKKKGTDTHETIKTVLDEFPIVKLGGKDVRIVTSTDVDQVGVTSPYAEMTVEEMLVKRDPALSSGLEKVYSNAYLWAKTSFPRLDDSEVIEEAEFRVNQMLLSILGSGYWNPEACKETVGTILETAMCTKAKSLLELKHTPQFLTDIPGPDQKTVSEEFQLDFAKLVIVTVDAYHILLSESVNKMTTFGLAPVVADIMRQGCPDRKYWTPAVTDFITYLVLLAKMKLTKGKMESLGPKLATACKYFMKIQLQKFHNFDKNISNPWYDAIIGEIATEVVETNLNDEEFMASAKQMYLSVKPRKSEKRAQDSDSDDDSE